MFDTLSWLNDSGIPYSLSGKNISNGWVGVSCPICSDRSNHCGISPEGNAFSCFRCGAKGHISKLISIIENVNYNQVQNIINKYSNVLNAPINFKRNRAAKVEWPVELYKNILPMHLEYLKSRSYDIDYLIQNYDIKFGGYTGPFKYRIIIPVYLNGRVVSYIGRDLTGTQHLKYKNLKEELSVLPVKETVYNIDNVFDEAIICEGVFDAWRFGYNAVALFGLVFTQSQVNMLGNKLKKAYICFDKDDQAKQAAIELAEALSWQGVSTEILLIDVKDPGEMSIKEADLVKKQLFENNIKFGG